MADTVALKFSFSTEPSSDIRTFVVNVIPREDGILPYVLYRFYHPLAGTPNGLTTFYRRNRETSILETAGQIEWTSNLNAVVHFGVEEVAIKDLRKLNKSTSNSRRFKVSGVEYKWKIGNNGTDLDCTDNRGRFIAAWSQEKMLLRVAPKSEEVLDRIVVTCLLGLWFRDLGCW